MSFLEYKISLHIFFSGVELFWRIIVCFHFDGCLIFLYFFFFFLNELELKYFLYPLNIIIREYTLNIFCPFASFLKLKKEDLNSIYRFIEILEAGTILRIEIRIV